MARAQEPGQLFLALRGGLHSQSAEDNLKGPSLGAGLSFGTMLSPNWGFELEGWIPQYINKESTPVRDQIFGIKLIRRFQADRVYPYFISGIAFAKVEQRSELGTHSNGHGYFTAGFGMEVPLTSQVSIAPERRANCS